MSTGRLRTAAAGAAVALTTGIVVDQGSLLGADLPRAAVLGVTLGAVIGLVPDRTVVGRTSALVTGVGAGWLGYAMRAGFLPDIAMGRAVAATTAVLVVTAVVVASAGRLPLWAGLLGLAAVAGAYETTFNADPTGFVAGSTAAVTSVLVAAALGLLVAGAIEPLSHRATAGPVDEPTDEAQPPPRRRLPSPRQAVDADIEEEVSR